MAKLHWWDQDISEAWFLSRIQQFRSKLQNHPRLAEYSAKIASAEAIASDLAAEGTVPKNSTSILGHLQSIFEAHVEESHAEEVSWCSDGAEDDEGREQQLSQHAKAFRYLWTLPEDQRLSIEIVKMAHGILMRGAKADNDNAFAGMFRTQDAYALSNKQNTQVFVCPADIEDRLQLALDRLQPDSLESIAVFLERFVYVHPFKDGNGRLARLLVSRCLKIYGLPIPTTLKGSSRKPSKANKRYMSVLFRAREQRGDNPYEHLRLFLTEVVYSAWQGFDNYVALRGG